MSQLVHRLVLVVALVLVLDGGAFADSFGHDPTTATPISPSSNSISGVIDPDVIQDWFSFEALPYVPYVITVTTGTIWDTMVWLKAPDGALTLAVSNSVSATGPASITLTNTGPVSTFYVGVGGFAEFTTGTYSLVVNQHAFADSNSNGIPDSWELLHLGTLTNSANTDYSGTGFTIYQDYLMGLDPTNAASGLFITSIQQQTNGAQVTWPAVQYGKYRVSFVTDLVNSISWTPLATTNSLATSFDTYSDFTASGATGRFYRVEFIY